jgi:hypothetical protein
VTPIEKIYLKETSVHASVFSPQERYAKVIGPASWGRHLAIGDVWRSCVEAVWKLLVETVKTDKRGKV